MNKDKFISNVLSFLKQETRYSDMKMFLQVLKELNKDLTNWKELSAVQKSDVSTSYIAIQEMARIGAINKD